MVLKIISLNCGSSSVKLSIFDFAGNGGKTAGELSPQGGFPQNDDISRNVPSAGFPDSAIFNIERTGSCKIEEIGTQYGSYNLIDKSPEGLLTAKKGGRNFSSHEEALNFIIKESEILKGRPADIVAHRFVHGGAKYINPLAVSKKDLHELSMLNRLAPLHNPSNLKGLEIMGDIIPGAMQVCVFDTAFHSTIPVYARLYPIPLEFYDEYGIRKYGFHGISYAFINKLIGISSARNDVGKNIKSIGGDGLAGKVDAAPKKQRSRDIICHLGNGASVCAIKNGKSVDTSMGYTPLDGLMMGTRSGSIDPEIPFILKEKLGATDSQVRDILNKKSGLLGVSGKTYDFKELLEMKDLRSKLAVKMYSYRISKFICEYAASMNGLDRLVFTGGVGENSDKLRAAVCRNLSFIGIKLDNALNYDAAVHFRSYNPFGRLDIKKSVKIISQDNKAAKGISSKKPDVIAAHTDEELQMAFESIRLYSL